MPHGIWGELIAAVIVSSGNAALNTEQVQEHCRRTLADFKVPRQVMFQSEPLPRTPTGKVQMFLLAERYRDAAGDV